MSYVEHLKLSVFKTFEKEHNDIVEKRGFNDKSNRFHILKSIFSLNENFEISNSLQELMKEMIKVFADKKDNITDTVFVDKYGSNTYRLQMNEYMAVSQSLGVNTSAAKNLFLNLVYSWGKENTAGAEKINSYFEKISIKNSGDGLIRASADAFDAVLHLKEEFFLIPFFLFENDYSIELSEDIYSTKEISEILEFNHKHNFRDVFDYLCNLIKYIDWYKEQGYPMYEYIPRLEVFLKEQVEFWKDKFEKIKNE